MLSNLKKEPFFAHPLLLSYFHLSAPSPEKGGLNVLKEVPRGYYDI